MGIPGATWFSTPLEPEHGSRIARDQGVRRHDCQATQNRLRDYAPVEGISVVLGKHDIVCCVPLVERQRLDLQSLATAGDE